MQIFGNVRKPFYSCIIYSTNICGDGGRKMAQFGFIGMGNMGYAMLNGVLENLHRDRLYLRHRTKKNVKKSAHRPV